jgi:hypothetical protein
MDLHRKVGSNNVFILFNRSHHLAVIKVNNTVLEEIVRRDRILRRNLQSSQRSADSPFPPESAEFPASCMPAQGDTASLDGNAIETQNTDVGASASTRGARRTGGKAS